MLSVKTRANLLTAGLIGAAIMVPLALTNPPSASAERTGIPATTDVANSKVRYQSVSINGVDVFYREAGRKDGPTVLLLHGFPTSSHMYRNLIPALSERYHVIAPDYPGFGQSGAPDRASFEYTFDNYAKVVEALTDKIGVKTYTLYLMDYGAPVGFRLAAKHPERVNALIVQNGNAYNEGIQEFWEPIQKYWSTGASEDREAIRWLTSLKATKWQYTHGVSDPKLVSPDAWTMDQARLDRPGNQEIQLDLFYDYRTNIPLYPQWQAYLRKHQPPTLVMWGKNDQIFVADGAAPYKRDLPNAEVHMIDTGHFVLESHGSEVAALITDFLGRNIPVRKAAR